MVDGNRPLEELKEKNSFLERQIQQLSQSKKLHLHDYYGKHIKIGAISDTHVGSLYANMNLIHLLYKVFKKEGVEAVYHSGDIVDGEGNYRGQHYEQSEVGLERQVDKVDKEYPNNGLKTYLIEGNHSFKKVSGAYVGKIISDRRKDIIFLDELEADIQIGGKNNTLLRMVHPAGGSAYALSYKPQKIIESYSGGRKPNIILIGHFHKAEYMPCYRNVFAIQSGTTQGQTPFMRAKGLSAHMGGWILDFYVDRHGVNQFKAEFIPYYER